MPDDTCSLDCQNLVDMPSTADDLWHHPNCPNHSSSCCGINDEPDFKSFDADLEAVLAQEAAQLRRWQERYDVLHGTMNGFENLVWMAQGILVGASLATEEIWTTWKYEDTLHLARYHWEMVRAWGFER